MESYLNPNHNFRYVKAKNSADEALQRRRNLCCVVFYFLLSVGLTCGVEELWFSALVSKQALFLRDQSTKGSTTSGNVCEGTFEYHGVLSTPKTPSGEINYNLEVVSVILHPLKQEPVKDQWIKGSIIGSGSFGTVYEGTNRDIKGANLLVDLSGVVKLADFGLAKQFSGLTLNLSLKGSVYWMAPEVIKVPAGGYNTAVDIWSLGCTIIEMFTGKHPGAGLEFLIFILIIYRLLTKLKEERKNLYPCKWEI